MDLNANLHGNWTLENAKARLNQFFQKEKTSAEYKYSQVGPDHNRSGSESSEVLRPAAGVRDFVFFSASLLTVQLRLSDASVSLTQEKVDLKKTLCSFSTHCCTYSF